MVLNIQEIDLAIIRYKIEISHEESEWQGPPGGGRGGGRWAQQDMAVTHGRAGPTTHRSSGLASPVPKQTSLCTFSIEQSPKDGQNSDLK